MKVECEVEFEAVEVGLGPVLVDREVTLHHHHGKSPLQSSELLVEGSVIEGVLVFQ